MEYRSSNAGQHISNDIVAGVGSSHGVQLSGGSTGGMVTAVGDDANIALSIIPKGQGPLLLGNSSTPIRVADGSTTALFGIKRHLVQFTVPALSSAGSAESTVTVAGLTTNSILVFQPRVQMNSTVVGVFGTVRCSTANELVIEFHNGSLSTLSGSTQSAYLLQFLF